MTTNRITILCVVAIILGTGAVHLATIRDGHNWGGDFSFYIHHAKNLSEGRSYIDIGHVEHPEYVFAPSATPPVFPMLLVGPYKAFGLDLLMLKRPNVLYLAAALIFLFKLF